MKQKRVFLATIEDAKQFVAAATKCDFDIDIYYNRIIIDAKSILGVLSLDLKRVLTVEFNGENEEFEAFLEKKSAGPGVMEPADFLFPSVPFNFDSVLPLSALRLTFVLPRCFFPPSKIVARRLISRGPRFQIPGKRSWQPFAQETARCRKRN